MISMMEKLNCFHLTGLITLVGAIDVKIGGSVLEEKSYFKILGLTFSSKLNWGSYIISIAKTVSKKIGVLLCSMKFLSPEVALYLYESTICPCMEYCCQVWAGALITSNTINSNPNALRINFLVYIFHYSLGYGRTWQHHPIHKK